MLADCVGMLSTEVRNKDAKIQELEQKVLTLSTDVKGKSNKIQEFENKWKEKDDQVEKLENETLALGKIFTAERESLQHKIKSLQQELSSSKREMLSLQQTISLLQEGKDYLVILHFVSYM